MLNANGAKEAEVAVAILEAPRAESPGNGQNPRPMQAESGTPKFIGEGRPRSDRESLSGGE